MAPESSADNSTGTRKGSMSTSEQRTLLFTNLPEKPTHAELTSYIKGGILLDIYVRNDRTAIVSFAEGASEFLHYEIGRAHV